MDVHLDRGHPRAPQRLFDGPAHPLEDISKPIKLVAEAAAQAAYQLLGGDKPKPTTTLVKTPSMLFTPTVVTRDNVKKIIFDAEIYTPAQVCTGEYAAACTSLGIQ